SWSRSDTARCGNCNRTGSCSDCGRPAGTLPGRHPGRPQATTKVSSQAEAHFGRKRVRVAQRRPDRLVEQPGLAPSRQSESPFSGPKSRLRESRQHYTVYWTAGGVKGNGPVDKRRYFLWLGLKLQVDALLL